MSRPYEGRGVGEERKRGIRVSYSKKIRLAMEEERGEDGIRDDMGGSME